MFLYMPEEKTLEQQQQQPPALSEVSLLKSEVERLQKENSELRNLCSGGRVPRYLPLSPSPQMQPASKAGGKHGHTSSSPSDNEAPTNTSAKPPSSKGGGGGGLKKIFCKIKRSNSGGQLGGGGGGDQAAAPSPQPSHGRHQGSSAAAAAASPHPPTPSEYQHFVRNGLRATAAGRLGIVHLLELSDFSLA